MYCNECGKPNPDYSKFCAFCGTKLLAPETEVTAEAPEALPSSAPIEKPVPEPTIVESTEPASNKPIPLKPDVIKSDPHQVFKRPMDSETVRPLADNPAQPGRPQRAIEPLSDLDFGDSGNKARPLTPPPQKPAAGPITASGNRVPPPARPQNVKKPGHYQSISHRPPTASPYKQTQQKRAHERKDDDLFFEDIAPDEVYEAEEDKLANHLKAIIATLFVLAVMCVLGWLFFTVDGQVFRAGLGMDAPAGAYRILGDRAREQGHVQSASTSYHEALKRDPTNFEYAMLIAETASQSGDADLANRAYQKCIELRPESAESYRQLAELLESRGNGDMGEQWRRLGYEKSGDESLIEMFRTPEPTPTPIPTPSVPSFSDIAGEIPPEG